MSKRKLIIFLFLIVAVLASCNQSTDQPVAEDLPKGIFYQVSGGVGEMYLFGSIHVGYEDMYPLHPEVESAFENSDYLALEIDLRNINQNELIQSFMQYGFYQDDDKLSNHVSEENFEKVLEIVEPAYINRESLENFKPWYAAQLATQIVVENTKFSTEHGVEEYFLNKAVDKPVIALESIMDQLYPFSLLSEESNSIFFEESINELENIEDSMDELLSLWLEGDLAGASELRNEMTEEPSTESLAAYQEAFINLRDKNMADKLDQLLQDEGSYFVVVGYLHLVGNGSIPELLNEMGYEVKPVFN